MANARRFPTTVAALIVAFVGSIQGGSFPSRVPVLLELFTSEGCSSCPPADQLLATLDAQQPEPRAELIVLSEHVDYFDYQGWKDPFSNSQFTLRQESLSGSMRGGDVYTPQLVVDGQLSFVGSDRKKAIAAVQAVMGNPKIPLLLRGIVREHNQLSATVELERSPDFKASAANLYVAVAEERLTSQVGGGENSGRSLTHVAVVRLLKLAKRIDVRSGSATEVRIALQPGWGASGLRLVAFAEDTVSRQIISAGVRKIKP